MRQVLLVGLVVLQSCVFFQRGLAGTYPVASTAEANTLTLKLRANQFLRHATFGPRQSEIDALATRMGQIGVVAAAEEWIDTQFAIAPSLHTPLITQMHEADGFTNKKEPNISIVRYRYHAWWTNAVRAPDQLKQRLAWALLQICVVGDSGNNFNFVETPTNQPNLPYWYGLSRYYDMMLGNLDGTYGDLLGDVTYHPIMGIWLSHLRNRKASATTVPDQNYAREVMQLFSIGLYELNPDGTDRLAIAGDVGPDGEPIPVGESIPTYDSATIAEFARLFTGFNYAGSTSITSGPADYLNPMRTHNNEHDFGAKNLLNGYVSPSNRTNANTDIQDGLNNLYSHPNVAPFISRLLIQRFVRSNPSKDYISRVSAAFNGSGGLANKGNFKAVMKAILVDPEAWDSLQMQTVTSPSVKLIVTGGGHERNKMIEPTIMYAAWMRQFEKYNGTTPEAARLNMTDISGQWSQGPYRSPSVFNFYLPSFQPSGYLPDNTPSPSIPGGRLVAPEFQILTGVVANSWQNRYRSDIINGFYQVNLYTPAGSPAVTFRVNFDFADEIALAKFPRGATTAGKIAQLGKLMAHLDTVLCSGSMSESFKNVVIKSMIKHSPNASSGDDRDRALGAIMAVVNSPYCLIVP